MAKATVQSVTGLAEDFDQKSFDKQTMKSLGPLHLDTCVGFLEEKWQKFYAEQLILLQKLIVVILFAILWLMLGSSAHLNAIFPISQDIVFLSFLWHS